MKYLYFFLGIIFFLGSTTIKAMDVEVEYDINLNIPIENPIHKKLCDAIKNGDAKIAYEMLEHIASLSEYDQKEIFKSHDENGNTLLHVLPALGLSYDVAFDIFTKLVGMGHPLIVRNNQNQTPLHLAVNISCPKTCLFLIEHAPILLDIVDNDGQFPLHIAASNLNEVMLKVLLDAGSAMQLFAQDWHQKIPVSYLVENLEYYRYDYSRGLCSWEFNESIFKLLITYMDNNGLEKLKEMLDEQKGNTSKRHESLYKLIEESINLKLKRKVTTLLHSQIRKRTRS